MKIKIFSQAVLEGRLNTGKKICQIWAESAVHVDSYLQNCLRNDFCFHKKLTFHSCIMILYGSYCWFMLSTLLPFGTRCDKRTINLFSDNFIAPFDWISNLKCRRLNLLNFRSCHVCFSNFIYI